MADILFTSGRHRLETQVFYFLYKAIKNSGVSLKFMKGQASRWRLVPHSSSPNKGGRLELNGQFPTNTRTSAPYQAVHGTLDKKKMIKNSTESTKHDKEKNNNSNSLCQYIQEIHTCKLLLRKLIEGPDS